MASPLQTVHHVVSDEDNVGLETHGRQKRKAVQSSAGEPSPAPKKKKKKKNKGKHKHGSSLDLDPGFVKRSYAEYEGDPVQAVVNVILNMADVAKSKYEGNYRYFPSEYPMSEFLVLMMFSLFLSAAENDRTSEIKRREHAEKELARAEFNLKAARVDLEKMRKLRENLAKEKEEWLEERTGLKNQISELEGLRTKISELEGREAEKEKEITTLKAKVQELGESLEAARAEVVPVVESSGRVAELERLLAEEQAACSRVVQAAINQRKVGFNLAMQQAMVVNPELQAHEAVFSENYRVVEDSIVFVDRQKKTQTIIFSNKED